VGNYFGFGATLRRPRSAECHNYWKYKQISVQVCLSINVCWVELEDILDLKIFVNASAGHCKRCGGPHLVALASRTPVDVKLSRFKDENASKKRWANLLVFSTTHQFLCFQQLHSQLCELMVEHQYTAVPVHKMTWTPHFFNCIMNSMMKIQTC